MPEASQRREARHRPGGGGAAVCGGSLRNHFLVRVLLNAGDLLQLIDPRRKRRNLRPERANLILWSRSWAYSSPSTLRGQGRSGSAYLSGYLRIS